MARAMMDGGGGGMTGRETGAVEVDAGRDEAGALVSVSGGGEWLVTTRETMSLERRSASLKDG